MPPKYKPGGRRFPPKSASAPAGPTYSAPSAPGSSSSSSSPSGNGLDPEVEDQLELELCWCIQQLQTALNSGKLSERQSLDTHKTLNVLTSSTAPLIKKRQFMRTTFGDYRTKMANDQKKLGKTSAQVKFSTAGTSSKPNSTDNKKSIFLKKAATPGAAAENNDIKDAETANFRIKPTGNTFRFNFAEPEKS